MASERRIFLPNDNAESACIAPVGESIRLQEDEAHYARQVLRLADGATLTALDGHGNGAQVRLAHVGKRDAEVVLQTALAPMAALGQGPQLRLLLPLAKGERTDWCLEKLAELAVAEIVWVVCARSVVQPSHSNKVARLLRVARAASRQARHGRVPKLLGPMPLGEALATSAAQGCFVADVAKAGERLPRLPTALGQTRQQATVLVGPEGGLTEEELQAAEAQGYTRVSLGPHVLRVETAALAAAIACTLCEDLPDVATQRLPAL